MKRFNPAEIEPKWQKIWDETAIYKADLSSNKPHYVGMSMFNYPSGAGIHIGHAMNYTISDVMARFKRQQGYESYHPVGWDSFGLPAENYAIKTGISPQESMKKIIPSYHAQYKAMGWSNDWSKEIATSDPSYYKWTQWIFAEMYRQGLAYQDARMQWWCTKCQTVLANEQVIDGKCWRHDSADDPLVEKKEVKQWFFKITDYADELLDATDALDWSDVVKTAQKNWIGKSVGAEVEFAIAGTDKHVTVFTTRPDTLFGATFLVLAPEHDLIDSLTTSETEMAVKEYVKQSLKKTEIERQSESKDKTGIFTGSYATNPINGDKIPVWVADYVLGGYGTGAIMAVPAHDERDNEFAKKFELPIVPVVAQDFGAPIENAVDVTGAVVIVYDKTSNKFLGVTTKSNQGLWLNGGGSEGDETFEQTAIRELKEETGFSEYSSVVPLGEPVYSYYFNDVKKIAKRSYGQGFVFFVDKDKQGEPSHEDHETDFELGWYDYDALVDGVTRVGGGVEHWLAMLANAKRVVNGEDVEIFHGDGLLVNSRDFSGVPSAEARDLIIQHLEREGKGRAKTTYKIRDWSVSRQRYWGAPIPIVNCPKDGAVLVPDDQLPVILPELDDYAPSGDGRSALARATDWLQTTCSTCGGPAERETDTLDTYICSSWYELRYFDPTNQEKAFEPSVTNKWMPVDFYNGGDHATAHLIYVRFVARFFHKLGMLDDPEPFKKFLFNGKVKAADGTAFSKSKGNGVDPLEIIEQGYGADALRTYLMFAAPLELDSRWDSQGVPATHRFLSRIWNLVQEFNESNATDGENAVVLRAIHPVIKKVTHDLEQQKYNTAIAAMMKCINDLYVIKTAGFDGKASWRFALESLSALVAPFAPHTADELWQELGHQTSVQRDSWPSWDDQYLVSDTMTLAVQVNGKVRAEIALGRDADKETIEKAALANERIKEFIGDKPVKRVIVVPSKLINIVV
jgi:leucyl-tRNA synthetase